MVVVRDVVRTLLLSKARGFPNILDPGRSFERGDADTSEFVMVRAEVEAELRCCISRKSATLALNGFGGEIVQRGIANTDNAEVLGPSPSPVAEVIEIDIRFARGKEMTYASRSSVDRRPACCPIASLVEFAAPWPPLQERLGATKLLQ